MSGVAPNPSYGRYTAATDIILVVDIITCFHLTYFLFRERCRGIRGSLQQPPRGLNRLAADQRIRPRFHSAPNISIDAMGIQRH